MSFLSVLLLAAQAPISIPMELHDCVSSIRAVSLGGTQPKVQVTEEGDGVHRFRFTFDLPREVQQDDWRVTIEPAFEPAFHWSPHLTPTDRHVVDQHSFRSPALIMTGSACALAIVPDLDLLSRGSSVRWYLDLDAPARKLTLGMTETEVDDHVLYVRKPGASYPAGKTEVGFFVFASTSPDGVRNPFRPVLDFLWERYGRELFESGRPLVPDLTPYVEHTYRWAFESWRHAVWQEFELEGRKVGAPVFIVNQPQSPNYPGEVDEREFRSIWNQAWFSSLRSASGLFRWARRKGDEHLLEKARMAKELALAAPMREGFFPSVIATEMEKVSGFNRSRGWETAYWGNSDRNPGRLEPRLAPYHVLDMSWTALLMLRWHEELEPDERLLSYARRYGEALVRLQDERGFFPAWLDRETLKPLGILDDSPETSLSATFLLALARATGESDYGDRALRAMDAVLSEIVPEGRWEDFETYWSCSSYGSDDLIGKKVERNDLHKQNTFSMFWTAEALLESYRATGKKEYLEVGERVLDELLMAQASWQPPFYMSRFSEDSGS